MLKKEILEKVLEIALSTGGDFAEIFEEKKYKNGISMLNGIVENVNSGVVRGIGLRIYHGFESVYAYTNDLTEENLVEFAKKLSMAVEGNPVQKQVTLEEVVYENQHPVKIYPKEYPMDKKVELLKRANDAAKAYDEHISKVMASLIDEEQHVAIANSDGKYIQDTRIHTRMAVNAIASDGDLLETGTCSPGASKGMEFYEEAIPEETGKEAARIAMAMLYADDCPSGTMPVIMDNGFGGVIFHEACGHSLEASAVSKGQSVFSGKLNQKIASDCVTAIDDGTIPNAWSSSNIDDEGNFQKRRVLIENGILKSYLVDTLNGKRMGMESTSSSRRESYKYETTSRMTNTFIAPGKDTLEDMIKKTSYGLYAKRMGGGSVDPSTGDFNFAVNEGYLIVDGKITKPVKGATLIGNGADVLMKIDMVGSDLLRAQGMCGASSGSIPTDVGQPPLRVQDMIVGGKEGGSANE
ncbi:TldD/PmbA family protein [Amedibacterium intestinale]|uniref:TldD/PmbA family protein n=1 Tax=Amedibacterium intestinale TaxID=2583452 RepID=UPI000E535DDD|nr:TldD/PmbA family protein [Amedibacterium intestinale]RHO17602.1 TldD/PmbA family protein [Eubacterium sp. AM18-26]RHO21855.1 TldD/PmbA family protein [Eubacterium sp. AM18-10LB-B]